MRFYQPKTSPSSLPKISLSLSLSLSFISHHQPKSLIMDSRVKNCFGEMLKKCGSRNICLEWQEAIATLFAQLDHGKLTRLHHKSELSGAILYSYSLGPKICSCNLLMNWVLHLVFAVPG